jgi:hypothetical protein
MDNPTLEAIPTIEQTDQAEATKPIEIKISLPDVITVGVWLEYVKGRDAYTKLQLDRKLPTYELLADYAGVLQLIAQGIVHVRVEGGALPDRIKSYLDIKSADSFAVLDMAFVGAMVRAVAQPIERAVYGPLDLNTPVEISSAGS